jgi:hypothetical protein
MAMLEQSRVPLTFASRCRIAVVLLSIFSLTAIVATRFSVLDPALPRVATVKSQPSGTFRQHLLGDGLQWLAPAATFTLFQPPRSSILTIAVVIPSSTIHSKGWRYNRPPPADFLHVRLSTTGS